jgi:hypothetical protein
MKKIIKISSVILLGLAITFAGCKKKKEEVIPANQSSMSGDTTLNVTKDTVYAPGGDHKSRTFFNSAKLLVFTKDSIDKNLALSDDVIFGYSFSNDVTIGAELSNTFTFSADSLKNWHQKATIFRKNVTSAVFDSAHFKRALISAFNGATAYTGGGQGGYIAPLALNEVYAFQTAAGKYGLVKILAIKPGQDPYADYLVFQVKMEK